ncbi:hypothetical protein C8R44DRAFT_879324 [Mycena epipterygia]|nr:hypothetical protein C8R44DRAFT_879324 [Mycena epipterygia]
MSRPRLSETSLSLLASGPPTSTTTKVIFGAFLIASAARLIYFSSPTLLTRVLVAAIKQAEETYCEAIEAGVLSKSNLHIARLLSCLQVQVSHIREGRTFTVLNCITEVRALEAHIEISKEEHLHDPNALALEAVTQTVFIRQKHIHGSSF